MARQSTGILLDVLTANREKLVPCPHKDCSGSTNQFYSSHGLEQHWRRFHHRPSNHFSQDKVFMGQSLLRKIHFELVKEVLNEKFKSWSEREQVIMCLRWTFIIMCFNFWVSCWYFQDLYCKFQALALAIWAGARLDQGLELYFCL